MTSKEIASLVGCTEQYIRAITKKALENGIKTIEIKGLSFSFEVVSNSYGKSYVYETLATPTTPKKRVVSNSKVMISELPNINLEKPTAEDKKALINFYSTQKSSLQAVAEAYNIVFSNKYNVMSLERKFRRWIEAFKNSGAKALEDKRGLQKVSKVDHNMFLKSLVKNANFKTYFSRYCFFYCEKYNKEYNIYNPKSNLSYSGFKSYFNKHKNDLEVIALTRGKDFLEDMIPTFNNARSVDYPNEQWQIDATKIDVMARVPVFDGEVDYFSKTKSDEYKLERFTLVGIVDLFSGARVYELFHTGNSYSNTRLLKKAMFTMGTPDVIKGDNGKDYISKHFQDVLEHLGIVYWAATPYKGAEKGKIERGFRTLQHNHLFENLAGFTGHSTAQKIIIENQATKKSERRGLPTTLKEEMMWWWELGACIDGIVKHMFEKSFEKHTVEINIDENLDKKLGKRFTKSINKDGIAHNNTKYRSTRLWEVAKIRDKVLVIEDIEDQNKAYAVVNDEFVELVSDKYFDISPELAKEVKRAYKKRVNKTIKDIAKSGEDGLTKLQKLHKIQLMGDEFIEDTKKENKKSSVKKTKEVSSTSSAEVEFRDFLRKIS